MNSEDTRKVNIVKIIDNITFILLAIIHVLWALCIVERTLVSVLGIIHLYSWERTFLVIVSCITIYFTIDLYKNSILNIKHKNVMYRYSRSISMIKAILIDFLIFTTYVEPVESTVVFILILIGIRIYAHIEVVKDTKANMMKIINSLTDKINSK